MKRLMPRSVHVPPLMRTWKFTPIYPFPLNRHVTKSRALARESNSLPLESDSEPLDGRAPTGKSSRFRWQKIHIPKGFEGRRVITDQAANYSIARFNNPAIGWRKNQNKEKL
jgi:hypothetical protein